MGSKYSRKVHRRIARLFCTWWDELGLGLAHHHSSISDSSTTSIGLAEKCQTCILREKLLPLLTPARAAQVALLAVFSLGFFVTIVQAIRLTSIARLATYTDSKGSIQWSAVEINLGVVVACVPTFGPLVKRFGQKVSRGSKSKVSKIVNSSRRKTTDTRSRIPADLTRNWKGPTVAEDEIELWTSTNRIVGGTSRMHGSATTLDDDEDDRRSAAKSVLEQQIRVQHDVTVQLSEAEVRHG